jgi:putative Mn2+ efflux pump MntP
MGIIELVLIAVSLSMDAFAVALCKGLGMKRFRPRNAGIIALFFGAFQAAMPLLGWLLGRQFESYITTIDHWLAFGLLALIGGKMIYEALKADDCPVDSGETINYKRLTLMAIATSIDALAVGITFAFLQVRILPAVLVIGLITLALSFAGVYVGHRFGARLKQKAELLGGIVLVGIGTKILLEHLGVLG